MKIKRLYITDDPSPSARKELCWEDEYGNWNIGDTYSPNAFAQGYLANPGSIGSGQPESHPELKTRTIFVDWLTKGEDDGSFEAQCIVEPVIIEAYRRWNAGWYDDLPAGDVELPKPGKWTITPDGNQITRVSDI